MASRASSSLQEHLFCSSLSEEEAVNRFRAMRAEYQGFFMETDLARAWGHNVQFIKEAARCLRAALELAKERLQFLDTNPTLSVCQCRATIMRECLEPIRREVLLYPDFHAFQRVIRAEYASVGSDFDWMEHVRVLDAVLLDDEANALHYGGLRIIG